MRRAVLALITTVAGLVLLLGFKTRPASTSALPPAPAAAAPAPTRGNAATPRARASASAPAAKRTVVGSAVDTRYGPVQVQVTLAGTKVTDVATVQLPSDNPRDVEINNFAVPVLREEAIAAQSARIDVVSGATYTSEGYAQSLQSALDKAGG